MRGRGSMGGRWDSHSISASQEIPVLGVMAELLTNASGLFAEWWCQFFLPYSRRKQKQMSVKRERKRKNRGKGIRKEKGKEKEKKERKKERKKIPGMHPTMSLLPRKMIS